MVAAHLIMLIVLLAQGIPVPAAQSGAISGIVRGPDGKPVAGIRVSAMAQPDGKEEAFSSAALVSIAETDADGRYRLENIPPGRYYVTAGRIDLPTYYPGTPEMSAGTVIPITPGAAITGINFALNAASAGRAPDTSTFAPAALVLPLQVEVEGRGRIPISGPGGYTVLRFTRVGLTQSSWLLDTASISITSAPADYRVTVENLPEGYAVRKLTFGSVDLANETLKITPTSALSQASTGLSLTLAVDSPRQSTDGVRVTGQIKPGPRLLYLSDTPGILYADGTFEFRNVRPGRHRIVTLDNPATSRPFGASLVVGNSHVEGVNLSELAGLPYDVRAPATPNATGNYAAGTVIPLASLHGVVVKDAASQPAPEGNVYLVGHSWTVFRLEANGRFEIPRLLPGKYDLEIQALGYPTVRRSVLVGDDDIDLDLTAAFGEP